MSEILPDAPEANSGWKTRNHYFYEIVNSDGKKIGMQLAFSAKNIPPDQKAVCEEINVHFPAESKSVNWQWRHPFVSGNTRISESTPDEDIVSILNDQYARLCDFETKLVNALQADNEDA